jgi:hypothetical protein
MLTKKIIAVKKIKNTNKLRKISAFAILIFERFYLHNAVKINNNKNNNKMKVKFLLASILACIVSFGAVAQTWNCGAEGDGSNVIATLTEDGTLTISGKGAMANYGRASRVPWLMDNDVRLSIRTAVIEDGVTTIGSAAFSACNNLSQVTIANSVTEILGNAFNLCYALTEIVIPNSVTTIGLRAFARCTGLTKVNIPNSVTIIGENAFLGCTALTEAVIPHSVTEIYGRVFEGCIGLTAIEVDAANTNFTSVDGVLFNHNQTELIEYPAGKQGAYIVPRTVTSIHRGAFASCEGLTEIIIPTSVTAIASYTFWNCINLTDIYIPSSVTSLGENTFQGCAKLTRFYNNAPNPQQVNDVVFSRTDINKVTLYVPAASVPAYKEHSVWGKFNVVARSE